MQKINLSVGCTFLLKIIKEFDKLKRRNCCVFLNKRQIKLKLLIFKHILLRYVTLRGTDNKHIKFLVEKSFFSYTSIYSKKLIKVRKIFQTLRT